MTIRVNVHCGSPGVLQVNEYFDSAWQVVIDGRRVDLVKANGYLLGVLVPQGAHVVEFSYRPSTFHYLMPVGAFGFFLAVFIFSGEKRARKAFEVLELGVRKPADKAADLLERATQRLLAPLAGMKSTADQAGERGEIASSPPGVFTYGAFRASQFFPSLDGLRAIAVILVIVVHYAGESGAFLTGWLGVQAFFVLSGFLITTLLLREKESAGHVSLKSFYIRRAFRIMPVYFVVFAFVVWQSYRLGGESWAQIKAALPYYLTFFNEYSAPAPWKITWTLGIEWKFYLVWPALAFLVAWTGRQRIALGGVLLFILFASFGVGWLMPYHYSVLLMGGLLALVMHDRRGFSAVRHLGRPWVASVIGVAFILVQTQIGKLVPLYGDAIVANIYGVAVVLLIPAILGESWPKKLLSSTPFVFVGRRSYALYLVQIIASQSVTGYAPWRSAGWPEVFMVFVTGLLIADVLMRFVEKPVINFGRRFDSSRPKL